MKIEMERNQSGIKSDGKSSMHMVFAGNPGTGKTEIARIAARLMWEIGYLSRDVLVEADRSKLVAGYVGHTAPKRLCKKSVREEKETCTRGCGGVESLGWRKSNPIPVT